MAAAFRDEKRPVPSTRSRRTAAAASSTRDAKMFRQIVMGKPIIGARAVQQIRDGLDADILRSASSFFGVPNSRIQQITRVAASTANRLEKARARLDPAVSERIVRMAGVARMAIEVFEDNDAAVVWMREPNRALGGVAPLDFMDTEPGAASVRLVLSAIATGGAA